MSSTTRLAAAALLPLVLASACGGGSSTSSGLSKADYIKASEAICAKANTDLKAVPDPTGIADVQASLDSSLSIASAAVTKLDKLAQKQSDKSTLNGLLIAPLKSQVTTITAYSAAVKAAIPKGTAAVQAIPEPSPPVTDVAGIKAYGFTECATFADPST